MTRDTVVAASSIAGAVLFGRLGLAALEARLGPLPVGSESVLWAYVLAACVAAVTLGAWSRRADPSRGFDFGLLGGYGAMLIAGVLTLVVWFGLFYGTGAYEKGGYSRLMTGLLALLLITAFALTIAARLVASASRRDLWRVASFVGLGLFAFLAVLVALPLVFS